jgi:hypothetical protein
MGLVRERPFHAHGAVVLSDIHYRSPGAHTHGQMLGARLENITDCSQAYYSQNIGTPCLEYMLCTNAVRLAVAKGLHRQPADSIYLSEHERNQRSCIFWGAYCLEKQIASQSGRCSVRLVSNQNKCFQLIHLHNIGYRRQRDQLSTTHDHGFRRFVEHCILQSSDQTCPTVIQGGTASLERAGFS